MRLRAALALVVAAALTACFAPSYEATRCGVGDACPPPLSCTPSGLCAECGDGVITNGELCDDGNQADDDDCLAGCVPARCGYHVVDAHPTVAANHEDCDEGAVDTPTCNADCSRAWCGDGYLNPAYGETCDDGNATNGDGCRADCRAESCGNGVVDAGEDCDSGTGADTATCDHDCTFVVCGDNLINLAAGETCEAGGFDGGNCAHCQPARCGDGYLDLEEPRVEWCDDGNTDPNDGCPADCLMPQPP